MEAIEFLRQKGILGEIHTRWMITFSDGSQVDLVQLFEEYAALREPSVMVRSELLKDFADYIQERMWQHSDKDFSEFVDDFLKKNKKHTV